MRHVALFHSVYGLRPAVSAAADLFRAAGHHVTAPDLYAGRVAQSIEEGFAISGRVGWTTILRRAHEALDGLPADTVLAGLSMGAGVAGAVLAERPEAAGLLLLHGTGGDPRTVPAGLPVHVHVGEADAMFPPADVAAWRDAMTAAGAAVDLFTYPAVGHFFTDSGVSEFDPAAAELAWQRGLRFVDAL
ncbi:dienelactone hydrolase family protein [Virgisporangium aurantiacum]|uniref:Dienelactone hydrolase n=1 Tax=Virgisporangium aurantiacum TaxID=175570 RepID=A0A8J4E076_9ACTN|nr:dienelactone hydrolase family protein [Virgisporangium aurantiacum]GIJ54747.1 dienelactone hydrolase [Virgisporangium aurantiacum]